MRVHVSVCYMLHVGLRVFVIVIVTCEKVQKSCHVEQIASTRVFKACPTWVELLARRLALGSCVRAVHVCVYCGGVHMRLKAACDNWSHQ